MVVGLDGEAMALEGVAPAAMVESVEASAVGLAGGRTAEAAKAREARGWVAVDSVVEDATVATMAALKVEGTGVVTVEAAAREEARTEVASEVEVAEE